MTVAALLSCGREPQPVDKLGARDLLAAERQREPALVDLPPLWRKLFVMGTAWSYPIKGTREMRCEVIDVVEVFGGWRAQLSCQNAFPLQGSYVGTHDRLWRTDKAIEDIRELEDEDLVLTRMPSPGPHVRANRGDWCISKDDAVMCLRDDVGIVGGSQQAQSWGSIPASW
jgi:hypothetical protein